MQRGAFCQFSFWWIADLLTSSHPQMSASHLLGLGATNANLEKSDNAGFYFETDSYEACNEFCAFDIFFENP